MITKALRLADHLEQIAEYDSDLQVAAELRRLNQSEKEAWRYADELEQERKRLHEVNVELVEALEAALSDDQPYIEKCKKALAKATGEQYEN